MLQPAKCNGKYDTSAVRWITEYQRKCAIFIDTLRRLRQMGTWGLAYSDAHLVNYRAGSQQT
jgi:hypothetical protein